VIYHVSMHVRDHSMSNFGCTVTFVCILLIPVAS